jgi:uncharacterized membrane protein
MTLAPHQLAVVCIIAGIYIMFTGLTSKTLISESDIPATEEERARAKATPIGRIICVGIGLASCLYGMYHYCAERCSWKEGAYYPSVLSFVAIGYY